MLVLDYESLLVCRLFSYMSQQRFLKPCKPTPFLEQETSARSMSKMGTNERTLVARAS